ncbi:MAG: type I glutamate--ammonia ligase [Alphaproteobacteria bacterium]|nr:type I glutamate--ammonia ligase [Alphaproteobacteria bacterium]
MSETALHFKGFSDLKKFTDENDVQFVGFEFTDSRGKLQNTDQHIRTLDKDMFENGVMIDGSSIAGWKTIDKSDMCLVPDWSKCFLDPFSAQPTLKVFCTIKEPETKEAYERCPRNIAKKAEDYLKTSGIGDTAYFGPEAEFFVFDDVKMKADMNEVSYKLDSVEGPYNSDRDYPEGNMGHRPGVKGGYFPEAPIDSGTDLRAEMMTVMDSVGLSVEKHHHEVAPSQHELGFSFSTLVESADNTQLYKYVVHNVAHAYGKSATFLPKPIYGDNGSGMHVHQSVWKGGKPLFAGDKYAGLSDEALYYIGGIIKHAKALNAFTNPSTNSYKRLVPGYEAPVLLAYSSRNRSAACRIPHGESPKAKRVETRFPDPTANPYLAFSALLMAGLDGIENKIHPGEANDQDLYALSGEELAKIPNVCGSLREALDNLASDHDFLLKGDVFTKDMIEGYIDLKMEEVERYETMPHPIEFLMYYSA